MANDKLQVRSLVGSNKKISPTTILHMWTDGEVKRLDAPRGFSDKIPFTFTTGKETACLLESAKASKMLDIMHQTNCSKLYNHSVCMPPYGTKSARIVFVPPQGSSFQIVEEALAPSSSVSKASVELAWVVKKNGKTLEPAGMALVLSKQTIATPTGTIL